MATKALQAIRGMNDIVPEAVAYWQWLEALLRSLTEGFGYKEIRYPVVEQTALFQRSIGDVTDIVEKEMYTFADRNGDSLTLRPEGTAGCVRAGIEQALLFNQTQRLWYMGPMFRHERPQQGRYRQFHQFGLEAFGFAGPDIDAEVIVFAKTLLAKSGLLPKVKLQLNNIGTPACRKQYGQALIEYFSRYAADLDAESQRRLQSNPLRLLDSKNAAMAPIIANAPLLSDYLTAEAREHFEGLQQLLTMAAVDYTVNPRLVRGLDYYTHTVFEWVTDELGAQGTVCAGGRYDGLVALLGGKATPAIGFAVGLERFIQLLQQQLARAQVACNPHAYLISLGEMAKQQAWQLSLQLRERLPALRLICHCGAGKWKAQFRQADKSAADLALIIGEEEAKQQLITVKPLRQQAEQCTMPQEQFFAYLEEYLQRA